MLSERYESYLSQPSSGHSPEVMEQQSTKPPHAPTGNPFGAQSTHITHHPHVRPPTSVQGQPYSQMPIHLQTDTSRAQPYQNAPVQKTVDVQVVPISNLSPYIPRWKIKARVIRKDDLRTWSNSQKEGHILNVVLQDASQSSIKATFWNDDAVKWNDLLVEGSVYTFCKGQVKSADKRWNKTGHKFEISFSKETEIVEQMEDGSIAKESFEFKKISEVDNLHKGDLVDVLGVVIGATDISTIVVKSSGKQKSKREVTLMDDSSASITVTLWENKVNIVDESRLQQVISGHVELPIVLACKQLAVDEYNGRRLSLGFEAKVIVDPDLPEAGALRQWFVNEGITSNPTNLSAAGKTDLPRMSILDVLQASALPDNAKLMDDKGLWCSVTATVNNINMDRNWFWLACPTCRKKVVPLEDQVGHGGVHSCQTCNTTVTPIRKYNLRLEIMDETGSMELQCLGDANLPLMANVDADRMGRLQEGETMEDGQTFMDAFRFSFHKLFMFNVVCKHDYFRDNKRTSYKATSMQLVEADLAAREAARIAEELC